MEKEFNLINYLVDTNKEDYNVRKCLEEMAELSEKLLKSLNKSQEYQPKASEIIEEIGDVQLRLSVLAIMYGEGAVVERVKYKTQKLTDKAKQGKYIGGL